MEVLAGVRVQRAHQAVRAQLLGLPVLALRGVLDYERAADLYRTLRRRGVTPRQLTDLLIVLCALDADAALLHADRDFDLFAPWVGHTRFLAGDLTLETVDNVRVEVAQALRAKALLSRVLSEEQYVVAVRSIDDLGVVVHATGVEDLERSAVLSARWNISFFDALVVDRALQRQLTLLTTDRKLCNAVGDRLSTELLRGIA